MVSMLVADQPLWLEVAHRSSYILLLIFFLLSIANIAVPSLRRKWSKGKIQLDDEYVAQTRKGLFSKLLLEHIDSDLTEDGIPIDPTKFWKTTFPLRLLVLTLAWTNVGIHIYMLVLRFRLVLTAWSIVRLIAETLVGTYAVILAGFLCFNKSVIRHRSLTRHICAIAGTLVLHWYLMTFGRYLDVNNVSIIHWTEYTILALSLALVAASGSIPLGPELHQDMLKIYNKAVAARLIDLGYSAEGATEPNVNQEVSASIFSILSFSFVYPMINKTSAMDQVDITDLPVAHAYSRTQNILHDSVVANDQSGLQSSFGPTAALLYTVWAPEWKAVLQGFAYMIALCPLWYIPHICLQNILAILDGDGSNRAAVAFAVLFVLARVGNLLIVLQQNNLSSLYVNPRITTHASFLLFQKVLTRNAYSSPERTERSDTKTVHTKADILNLISSDTTALARVGWTFISLFRACIELFLGMSYVWLLLGPSGFYGLATIVITFPPAYILTKLEYKCFEQQLQIKDEKISLMQEAIQAISMIKMMAAEKFWYNRINEVRDRQFQKTIQANLLGTFSGLLYAAAPTLIVAVAFAHYTLVAKQTLSASIAFTSIAVFDELRPTLMEFPTSIADLLQEVLSAKRIGRFLRARDVDYLLEVPYDQKLLPESDKISIHGTFTWDVAKPSSAKDAAVNPIFQLRDLQLDFPKGKMTLVAGKFGSGKSLLLLALLGEARLVEGKVSYLVSSLLDPHDASVPDWALRQGAVAYVPQTAWLQSQSIRENILFGLPMDFERYRAVMFAVGLLPDLEILDDADLTEIGERGKILSGGQKARVSLARAVYSRASIILLDDVISAVDAQTSKHIVEHCFSSPLMAGRTIIIASHAVEALAPLAYHSVFLDDGRAVWTGSGQELLESEHMKHLKTDPKRINYENSENPDSEKEIGIDQKDTGYAADNGIDPNIPAKPASVFSSLGEKKAMDKFELKEAISKTPKQLILEEGRDKGTVEFRHWRDLKRFNGTNVFWAGALTLLLLSTILPVVEKTVLEMWTRDTPTSSSGSLPVASHSVVFWVSLYGGLSLSTNIIQASSRLFRFFGGIRATKRVHSEMLESMLRTKMSFFSQTRAGSIVQRFGQDLMDVLSCSQTVGSTGEYLAHVVISIVTVSVKGGWIFGLIVILLIAGIWQPGKWYRSSSRQMRRLAAIIPGPINAIYGETIAGTAVIRAFGVQSVFIEGLLRDLNMKINVFAWSTYIARWLFATLRILDVVIVSTTFYLILTREGMTGAAAGFMLVFASGITYLINVILLNVRQVELKGISLERTSEYRLLPREDGEILNLNEPRAFDSVQESFAPQGQWPTKGAIKVEELRARYGPEMPDILHDVSFEIEGGQRVGIVGATGGGKSTLAKAFFSFVDITHGKIEIDGRAILTELILDIAQIPLGQVRSNLGIIAQDPILLSGSLRLNLDIEGKYSDDELYDALHQVQLFKRSSSAGSSNSSESEVTVVEEEAGQTNIFSNLESEIKSGGDNLSAGQKQLVVLARALLKHHKVLILDEATASIDSATDAEISRVVHEEFKGVTVLIIAHRLRTIMPCSKILVMDKGRLVQQGSPIELIKVDGGKFQTLCKAAGQEEYQHLLSLADSASKVA